MKYKEKYEELLKHIEFYKEFTQDKVVAAAKTGNREDFYKALGRFEMVRYIDGWSGIDVVREEARLFPSGKEEPNIEELMFNVLADANGVSSYWCNGCNTDTEVAGTFNCIEDRWMAHLKDGGSLDVLDEDGVHKVTYTNLKEALLKWYKKKYNTSSPTEEQLNDWDGNDADAVFQIAALGEVVYG